MPKIREGQRINTGFEPAVSLGGKKEEMSFTALVSTERVNRMGMVVLNTAFNRKALANFRKQPVLIDSHHGWDLKNILGSWENLKVTKDGLIGTARYMEHYEPAEHAYKLTQMGLGAFSIAFNVVDMATGEDEIKKNKAIPAKIKKAKPEAVITALELMEISQCCVPVNPDTVNSWVANSRDREGAESLVRLAVESGYYETEPEILPPPVNPRKKEITRLYLSKIQQRNELDLLLMELNT